MKINSTGVLRLSLAGLLAVGGLSPMGAGLVYAQDSSASAQDAGVAQEGSTVIYDEAFFAQYPSVVSVRDLIDRIPGGRQIVGARRGGDDDNQKRGFSNTDDRVLINGRRISGKGASASTALDRITMDQVERIEIIRGGSPDIKVSSQEAIVNIVLKDDVSSGSGSWRAEGLLTEDGRVRGGGFLSYGGSVGTVDFFASVEARPDQRRFKQWEEIFDQSDILTQRIEEAVIRDRTDYKGSANITINLDNGDQVRLNGSFSENGERRTQPGMNFYPDGLGQLVQGDDSYRFQDKVNPRWEVSGDYETDLTSTLSFKIIGLYGERTNDNLQQEDYEVLGDEPAFDTVSDKEQLTSEAIARLSLKWSPGGDHEIEIGSEGALNKLRSTLSLFERENGELVEQDVDGALTQIREKRLESFLIHSWTLSGKASLESALFTEVSTIEQLGDFPNSRDLFYLRPSVDFRYDISASRQFQFSIRRDVGQLDFSDFATTINEDDEVVGGNPDLVPWKSWDIEATFEQRLPEDAGFIRLTPWLAFAQDATEQVEVRPGVSGKGPAGDVTSYGLRVKSSFRLDSLGIEGGVLELEGEVNHSEMTDAFTGETRRPTWRQAWNANVNYRQDINDWGLSYGASLRSRAKERFWDLDEFRDARAPRMWVSAFVEKTLPAGLTARFAVSNIFNVDFGRTRYIYGAGRVTGILTSREVRDQRIGRHFRLSLKGTF